MKRDKWICGFIVCCAIAAVAQGRQAATAGRHESRGQITKSQVGRSADVGELKFQQNCSRCHNAPQELPTRISGTIALHMRVRASLSSEDVKAILQYLAP